MTILKDQYTNTFERTFTRLGWHQQTTLKRLHFLQNNNKLGTSKNIRCVCKNY